MEKETIEEAAKAKFPFQPLTKVSITRKKREAFIEGAKWQAERSYSEKDMIAFLDWSKSTNQEKSEYELKCLLSGVVIDSKTLFNMWAKQFKKK
jgi:hypothetical protein